MFGCTGMILTALIGASKGDKHPTDLAMLRGARLVTASRSGQRWRGAFPVSALSRRRPMKTTDDAR